MVMTEIASPTTIDTRCPSTTVSGWVVSVEAAVRVVPREQFRTPARESMSAVARALAAAADAQGRVAAGRTAIHLARDAGVGDRVWQKRTQWLRENGWLRRGPGGLKDGWLLCTPA
ncbi:hypothetical protein GCM10027519_07570 [Kineococcus endophyticus]